MRIRMFGRFVENIGKVVGMLKIQKYLTSRSNLPARLRAGSKESGLFVAPITRTWSPLGTLLSSGIQHHHNLFIIPVVFRTSTTPPYHLGRLIAVPLSFSPFLSARAGGLELSHQLRL